jgi:hypothetical protein
LDKAVDDWNETDEDEWDKATFVTHFSRANILRCNKETSLKKILGEPMLPSSMEQPNPPGPRHHPGLGLLLVPRTMRPHQRHLHQAGQPKATYRQFATLANLSGSCTFIQRPDGFKSVWQFPCDPNKEKENCRNKDQKKKAAAATAKAITDAVAKAMAAHGITEA